MDITRDFFYGRFPVKFAKLSKIFWKVFRFRGSELLVYNEGTFFQLGHRGKEPYIRNPGIPSPSKRGTLHKEPLATVKQSHRKEGYRRFRPASAVCLSAQTLCRVAKTFESR